MIYLLMSCKSLVQYKYFYNTTLVLSSPHKSFMPHFPSLEGYNVHPKLASHAHLKEDRDVPNGIEVHPGGSILSLFYLHPVPNM